ncbi:MAG: carboxypeptidase regulatory-like domain-containing protein [Bacteroidota bacterium]
MKQKLHIFRKTVNLFYFVGILSLNSFCQITTSSINGLVSDSQGNTLPGATVIATHLPSGTKYGMNARADGRYSLNNVRIGGPYSIQASFVGFKEETIEVLKLDLGQKLQQDFRLMAVTSTLEEVVIKADPNLNNQRTGAANNISSEQLRSLPTITRSASDFTRLTPMAGDNNSFGGRNGQFNNFSLDGAIFNNPFGLDAATPGGQSDAQPVSLDAIDQIQVAIAPYDVTQSGFTGASINAVTKSGTNQFHGTAFLLFRNQSMTGSKVDGADVFVPDLNQNQFGFSIGGPLIKNKLFFFANFESDKRSDLGSSFLAARSGLTGTNISRVTASDLDAVSAALKGIGIETGAYENFTHKTESIKGILKLDWNINQNHKFSFTYSGLDAFKQKPAHPSAIGRRGPDFLTLQFYNSGYQINNKLESFVVDLKSNFSNKASNKLQVGVSQFNDSRDPFSAPAPTININKDGVRYIVAGHEPFSINNRLDQDVIQLTDNLNLYLGKHTLTLGASIEKFQFDNSFNLGAYPGVFAPGYESVDAFLAEVGKGTVAADLAASRATFSTNSIKNSWALAETNLGQMAIYAQDEFQINPKFTLTAGIRVDKPNYYDTKEKIEENISRNCCYDPTVKYYDAEGKETLLDSKVLPSTQPLISPRIGFNYDKNGDRTEQIRGGTGIFTGRFPMVWVGNQVANPNFFFYCVTDPDFKFPQVWRTNLGYDKKLKNGWILTTDIIYTKDINAMIVRNYGLKLPTTKLQGVDNRPFYNSVTDRAQLFGAPTTAYVFTNTNLGYSFNWTVQAKKTWENGLDISLGYNYLKSMDAASIQAEISSDAYDRNPANLSHTNTPLLAPSAFGNTHRFVGTISKKFVYADGKMATTVSVFDQIVSGGRYSYTYSGDINNDGSGLNDLLYIPTDAQIDQMAFNGDASAQRAGFKSYIAQDKYLSDNRGKYAEKYSSAVPAYQSLDISILQDFVMANKHKLQGSLTILNAGNMISSKWGVRQIVGVTNLTQPLGVSVDSAGKPTYNFDTAQKSTFFNDNSLISRWQAQIGLRYIF